MEINKMTKGAAIQSFFERFMDAYAVSSVPEDVVFPYLTYEYTVDAWDGGEVGITANLWFYTESEAIPNAYSRICLAMREPNTRSSACTSHCCTSAQV